MSIDAKTNGTNKNDAANVDAARPHEVNAGRRAFLQASGAAALTTAVSSLFPAGVFAQGAGPETQKVVLG